MKEEVILQVVPLEMWHMRSAWAGAAAASGCVLFHVCAAVTEHTLSSLIFQSHKTLK